MVGKTFSLFTQENSLVAGSSGKNAFQTYLIACLQYFSALICHRSLPPPRHCAIIDILKTLDFHSTRFPLLHDDVNYDVEVDCTKSTSASHNTVGKNINKRTRNEQNINSISFCSQFSLAETFHEENSSLEIENKHCAM